jgi:hypothetical protein
MSASTFQTSQHSGPAWQPIAYVALADPDARHRLATLLERAGWTVIVPPTGFHLVRAIAGVIEGQHLWRRPSLIVVDAWARGCAGTTIATGLRELGIMIPIVLVAAPGESLPVSSLPRVHIVERELAERVVADLAGAAGPRRLETRASA